MLDANTIDIIASYRMKEIRIKYSNINRFYMDASSFVPQIALYMSSGKSLNNEVVNKNEVVGE